MSRPLTNGLGDCNVDGSFGITYRRQQEQEQEQRTAAMIQLAGGAVDLGDCR